MRTIILTTTIGALLAACGAQTWPTTVTNIQAAVPVLEAGIAAEVPPADQAAVKKLETQLNADVAALSGTVSPNSAGAVLSDVTLLVAALPPGTLSPAHEAELEGLLALAKLLVSQQPS